MDGAGRGCTCPRASFSCDDVHELHLRLQPHSQTTPLQCVWQGQTQSLLSLERGWRLAVNLFGDIGDIILPYFTVTLEIFTVDVSRCH